MISEALLQSCELLMKQGSSSFYQAFQYLPSPKKEAVYVIYAFCRIIDDSVDDPETSPFTLSELEQNFRNLEQAEGHFIWPSLQWLFSAFPISKEPFFKQMSGQAFDLTFTHYNTLEELEVYCEKVAGSVGEMLLPVLHDHPGEKEVQSGILLGKAMQIVNIIRDVGEDRERGRRYIPFQTMNEHGYSMEDFHNGKINSSFKSMIDEMMELALRWFHEGLGSVESYPPKSAFCINLATGYYAAIMDAVLENEYQVYSMRAYVDDEKKREIFLKSLEAGSAILECRTGAVGLEV